MIENNCTESLITTLSSHGALNAADTALTACPKVPNWYFSGTNSVWPPISGTTGIKPELIASTVEIPKGSPGNGCK